MPRWFRRLFPGQWTASEVAAIQKRAAERHERMQRLIE